MHHTTNTLKTFKEKFYCMSQLQSSFVKNIFYRHVHLRRLDKYKSVKVMTTVITVQHHTSEAAIFRGT